MSQNLEEQKFKQLFREARRVDELCLPSFVETLAVARLNNRHKGWRLPIWRTALVAVALMVIGITAFVFFKQQKARPAQEATYSPQTLERHSYQPDQPRPNVPAISHLEPPQTGKPRFVHVSASRRGPHPAGRQLEIEPSALLSLKWQSPTAFLLRTPGADLLKSMPRIGDSLIRFDVIHSDEKN